MDKLQWTTEKRLVKDLKLWGKNPRKITREQAERLYESLNKFNLVEIPAIDTDNTIIAGHQRITILLALGRGEESIDVRVPNRKLTDDEFQEYNLRSNKNTGEWDYELLANFDEAMLLAVGFKDEMDLIFQNKDKDDNFDVDEALGAIVEPKAKRGDVYALGPHRLMCGDATSADDLRILMQGKRAQMCFTDPPYNVNYTGGMGTHEKHEREGILNDHMGKGQFYEFLKNSCSNIIAHTEGGVYVCMSSSELETLKTAFEASGGHWQSYIIWVKNTFTLSRADYQHQYEPIFYGWPQASKNHYFTERRDLGNVWEDLREIKSSFDGNYTTIKFQGYEVKIKGKAEGSVQRKKWKVDIWRYDKPVKSADHPTMKPVPMVIEAVANSSKIGDIVLDIFGGSGSTLIASEQSRRACYMLELDPKYVDVIIARWERLTGQKAAKTI